ncbi:MAG TPA: cysteine desulfurase [Syntrophus sp. (in: bacteria)]|nr:cysteine desulfurase [Syntrophus sp. (in: bacteria)]
MLYFDNAATSCPKPPETLRAMRRFMEAGGGSPGRSGHRLSIAAARVIFAAREALAGLFGVDDPLRIVLTKNATEALNIAAAGLLPGDHVITSGMEHNSVMRPLRALEAAGVALTVVSCSAAGELDPDDVRAAIRTETKAIFLTHASNVTGTIMPVAEVGRIARDHGILFCVDAAQTAGALPIDVGPMGIDLLAFTGHKSLFGPQGTGGLYIREGLEEGIAPLMRGGTGSRSEFEEQPAFMPDRYESGTPNTVGIAGLAAGAGFVAEKGVDAIRRREEALTEQFLAGLRDLDGVTVYGPKAASRQMPVVSFRIVGLDPAEAALKLDERFGILSRPGLHCAPAAHRTIGTAPTGTLRFSFGYFNTEAEIRTAVEAVGRLRAR